MIYLGIGILAGIYEGRGMYKKNRKHYIREGIITGVLATLVFSFFGFMVLLSDSWEYDSDDYRYEQHNYEITQTEDKEWYEINADDTVSIYIKNSDTTCKKVTYHKNLVEYKVGDTPQISVTTRIHDANITKRLILLFEFSHSFVSKVEIIVPDRTLAEVK